MSIEAHPNFHAVKFVTNIAGIWHSSKRLPTPDELRVAYRTSIRGRAEQRHEIDILLEEMIDSFQVIGKSALEARNEGFVVELIGSFARQASERLDEAVCKSQSTSSTPPSSLPPLEA